MTDKRALRALLSEWSDDDSGAELAAQQRPRMQKRTENSLTAGQDVKERRTQRVTRAQVRNWKQQSGENVVKLAPKDVDHRHFQEESSSSSSADEQRRDESADPSIRAAPRPSIRSRKPASGKGAQSLSARGKAAMPPLPKEASSEEEQPAPQRRKAGRSKPSRRQGSKLIQGGGDQSSEDYDDDIDDFIASSGEEGEDTAAESAEEGSDEKEDEGNQGLHNRAFSRGPRSRDGNHEHQPKQLQRLRKMGSSPQPEVQELADSSSDDDKPFAATIAQQKGKQPAAQEPPESDDDGQPGTSAQHARQASRAKRSAKLHDTTPAAELEDGSEEEEEPEPKVERSGKKRRRQEAARGGVTAREAAAGTDSMDDGDGEERVDDLQERSVKIKRLHKASGAVVTPGSQGEVGRGAVQTRTRTLPPRPSVLERLQQHQAAHALGKGGQRPQDSLEESEDEGDGSRNHQIPEDESDGDSAASDQPGLIVLDDEEEEAGVNGQAQDGSESEESLGSFIEEDDKADTGVQGFAVGSPLEGLGLLQRPELKASFDLYLDYLLYSLADPDFEAKLEADQRQRREYLAAVKRIEEEELARWREHFAKSDAWKRALPGFIPALERLPGLSMDQGHYDVSLNPGLEEDDPGEMRECAACERLHSRATMELTFKGRPYWPNYKYGTKSLAKMAIRSDDYDTDLEGEDGQRRERRYIVGQHCAVRVQLYHALWHYKHRIRGKLKKQLKKSRQYLQRVKRPSSWMDAAVNVTEHSRLYNALFYTFRGLKMAAERYSSSSVGGGYGRAGESIRKTSENVNKLIYRANSDSEGDEGSDIAFSDQDDAAGTEEEAVSGAEDEGDPAQAEADIGAAEEHADSDDEPLGSRQLNSQPVRRRLVLPDDSDADSHADIAADISAEQCTAATPKHASVGDTPALPVDDGAAAGTAADTAADISADLCTAAASDHLSVEDGSAEPRAEGAAAGTAAMPAAGGASQGGGSGAADAPVVALAAQSAAGVQAALQRAKTGASPPSSRGRTATKSGNASGGASSVPGSVRRQQGILAYFSPKKAST